MAALVTLGRLYATSLAKRIRVATDVPSNIVHPDVRTALVAHVYYVDVLDELLDCYSKLDSADLIVTTDSIRLNEVSARLAQINGATVVVYPNRGRDIAPFLQLLNGGTLDKYDAVLKLHTKKSPHLKTGKVRRHLLYSQLAGSHRTISNVMRLFEDSTTGLVGWGLAWRTEGSYWMKNKERVTEFSSMMSMSHFERPAFFEGSMFWVRPAALSRLKALQLSSEAFEAESKSETDGLLHHAVERLFARIVAADGYAVRSLTGRTLLS